LRRRATRSSPPRPMPASIQVPTTGGSVVIAGAAEGGRRAIRWTPMP
jgi:hypothetical protein